MLSQSRSGETARFSRFRRALGRPRQQSKLVLASRDQLHLPLTAAFLSQHPRRSFSIKLRNDSYLQGIEDLPYDPYESPILASINKSEIAQITSDNAIDAGEAAFLIERLLALSTIYNLGDLAQMMVEVEDNYAAIKGHPRPGQQAPGSDAAIRPAWQAGPSLSDLLNQATAAGKDRRLTEVDYRGEVSSPSAPGQGQDEGRKG